MSSALSILSQAIELIGQWERHGNLDIVVDKYRLKSSFDKKEQVIFLVKDYFRYASANRKFIFQVHRKRIDKKLRLVIDLSLIRLLYHRSIAQAMVVDSAVQWVKNNINKYAGGFVNQLLRKLSCLDSSCCQITDILPKKLQNYWNEKKRDVVSLAEVISNVPAIYTSVEEKIEHRALGEQVQFDWIEDSFFYPIEDFSLWQESRYFKQSYIQDPATLLSLSFLKPQRAENIADFCAAPGGKARLIAQKIGDKGKLFCVEISRWRAERLKENLIHFNNVEFFIGDCLQVKKRSFDAILLDVPCSNSGVYRRKPDAMWNFSQENLQELCILQKKLLYHSALLVKKGGRLVYSTCSIEEEENFLLLEQFLNDFSEFKLVQQRCLLPSKVNDGAYSALLQKK